MLQIDRLTRRAGSGWRISPPQALAEAVCGEEEIMAVLGHKTLCMVQKVHCWRTKEASRDQRGR